MLQHIQREKRIIELWASAFGFPTGCPLPDSRRLTLQFTYTYTYFFTYNCPRDDVFRKYCSVCERKH